MHLHRQSITTRRSSNVSDSVVVTFAAGMFSITRAFDCAPCLRRMNTMALPRALRGSPGKLLELSLQRCDTLPCECAIVYVCVSECCLCSLLLEDSRRRACKAVCLSCLDQCMPTFVLHQTCGDCKHTMCCNNYISDQPCNMS